MDYTIKQEKDFLKVGIQEAFLCSEYVLKYLPKGPERTQHLLNLEGLVKNYCVLDHHLQIRPGIVDGLANEDNERRSQENPEASAGDASIDYEKKLSDKVTKAMKKINVNQHKKFVEYKANVKKLENQADGTAGDDELTVTDESNTFIDPLSKTDIVDPVISTKCQHRFSRKTILQHLQGKSQAPCPYVGCRQKFGLDDIEDDVITAHTLKRAQKHKHI